MENWILLDSTWYDIENDRFDQARLGVGYVDVFMSSVNPADTAMLRCGGSGKNDTVMPQFRLRTRVRMRWRQFYIKEKATISR